MTSPSFRLESLHCDRPIDPLTVLSGKLADGTGCLLDIAAVTNRRTQNVIVGRNEGLPDLHLAELLLDVRPFEEPSAAPSRLPMHGRTPVYPRGGLSASIGASSALNISPMQFGIRNHCLGFLSQRPFGSASRLPALPITPEVAAAAQRFGQQDDISVIAVTRTAVMVPV